MFKFFSFTVLSTCLWLYEGQCNTIIATQSGIVQGTFRKTWNNRTFSSFTGIPYAKPPIGDLRFQPPVAVEPWMKMLDATSSHPICPQLNIFADIQVPIGSEDCLYLNIYTPKLCVSETVLFPVLVYLHGGSFYVGSGRDDWLGPEILLDRDILVVTLNYRLGSLGFLSLQDEVASGNNGLKDQTMALQWISKNIANFGGDPKKITLFGDSAGGISAHLHTVSPLSKGLYRSIIAQSGNALFATILSSQYDPVPAALKLGECVKCNYKSSKEFLTCLKQIEASKIIKCESQFLSWDNDTTIPFRPVVEKITLGAFLSEDPLLAIKSGRVQDVPIIMGVVANEGGYIAADLMKKPILIEILNNNFDQIVPLTFGLNRNPTEDTMAIKKFYFDDARIDQSNRFQLSDLYSDGMFIQVHDAAIRTHFQYLKSPIYQYLFGYRGAVSYGNLYSENYDYGVSHTDDLFYLLPRENLFPNYKPTDNDKKVAEVLTTLWVNFAHTGNPTPTTDTIISTVWQPVQTTNQEYLEIRSYADITMNDKLFFNRTSLWRKFTIL